MGVTDAIEAEPRGTMRGKDVPRRDQVSKVSAFLDAETPLAHAQRGEDELFVDKRNRRYAPEIEMSAFAMSGGSDSNHASCSSESTSLNAKLDVLTLSEGRGNGSRSLLSVERLPMPVATAPAPDEDVGDVMGEGDVSADDASEEVDGACIPSIDNLNGLSEAVKRCGSEKSGKASSLSEDVGTGRSRRVGSSFGDSVPDITFCIQSKDLERHEKRRLRKDRIQLSFEKEKERRKAGARVGR